MGGGGEEPKTLRNGHALEGLEGKEGLEFRVHIHDRHETSILTECPWGQEADGFTILSPTLSTTKIRVTVMVAELVAGCCAHGALPVCQALHSQHPVPPQSRREEQVL